MITPANALKFSLWLAANHPRAFQAVLSQTTRAQPTGLSGTSYIPAARRTASAARRFGDVYGDIDAGTYDASALRMGADSADVLEEFTPTASYLSFQSDPTLSSINFDMPEGGGFDLSGAASQVDNSGGFWSSLGSGLSSVGSGLTHAIGAVANAVLNPQTLAAAGTLAATVIKANGATSQQQAVLQSQISNTANGIGAHPVTYATNPATGQPMAMLYNPTTGQYQPAPAGSSMGTVFGSSGVAGSLTPYVPAILIGGGLLIAALILKR